VELMCNKIQTYAMHNTQNGYVRLTLYLAMIIYWP